ncbi:MAG: PASTA domain-containing protein [Ruminococcus sp.]
MKKYLTLILAIFIIITCITGCGNEETTQETTVNTATITIPDLTGLDETSAKTLLVNKGLIPAIEHNYDDTVEKGLVIETYPSAGSFVYEDDKVTVYISDGPSYIESEQATVKWYNNDDKWTFSNSFIEEGKLYFDCVTTFADSFEWDEGSKSNGEGFGEASINDTFDKTVPLSIVYQDKKIKANKEQSFTIVVPVTDLDVDLPTTMYLSLVGLKDDEQIDIRVDFNISW